MSKQTGKTTLPPAQPAYVLRGHSAQVHSVYFLRGNSRLLTGDADGWVVLWNIATKRPAAVWRAHQNAILGFEEWGDDKIITHGRDSHLRAWQLRGEDEPTFSTVLPVDDTSTHRKEPWLLHSLVVNTLNFCAFSLCHEPSTASSSEAPSSSTEVSQQDSVLLAVPGTKDDHVDIFHLPSERRTSTVPSLGFKTGMVMALSLRRPTASSSLQLISAYESGHAAVHVLDPVTNNWTQIYTSQAHSQPILSLSPLPSPPMGAGSAQTLTFYTSGADDIIAMHTIMLPSSTTAIPAAETGSEPEPIDPQQSVVETDDNAVGPSAPESSSTAQPLQAPTETPLTFKKQPLNPPSSTPSTLRTLLTPTSPSSSSPISPSPAPPNPSSPTPPSTTKTTQTKHSGQQSLCLRSDARLLATAGWDGSVRVYSARTLREVAVLKWHREGCYAVGFADVGAPPVVSGAGVGGVDGSGAGAGDGGGGGEGGVGGEEEKEGGGAVAVVGKAKETVRRRREDRARMVHWVAAGSKDGKVSLWDVF